MFVANVTEFFKRWVNSSDDMRLNSSTLTGVSSLRLL